MSVKNVLSTLLPVFVTVMVLLSGPASTVSESTGTEANGESGDILPTVSTRAPLAGGSEIHDLTFFLHNVTDLEPSKSLPGGNATWNWFDTTTEFNQENTTIEILGAINTLNWYLWPALAAPVNTSQLDLRLWMRASGTAPSAQIDMKVYEKNATGEELVWVQNFGSVQFVLTPELLTWSAGGSPHTFQAGSSIRVEMRINPGVNKNIYVMYDSPAANSRVVIPTRDHIDIDNITTLNYTSDPRVIFQTDEDNKTMYFRANVTDPLGGYDINSVKLTVSPQSGPPILNNVSMHWLSGTPISYNTVYNYTWNYSGYSPGKYDIAVWVVDNSGYTNYYHFALYTWGNYSLTGHSAFYIGDLPKYAWITVHDNSSLPLEGATVRAIANGVEVAVNATNATGMTNISLYPQQYDLAVEWQGIQVGLLSHDLQDNVSANGSLLINCSVFYPTLRVVDNSSAPLDNAAIYVTHPNSTVLPPVKTNGSGEYSLDKFPMGTTGIIVRWRGIEIYAGDVDINSSGTYQLNCSVYYMTVTAVKFNGGPLAGAVITAYDNSTGFILSFMMTNETGKAVIKVPAGTIDIGAYWQNAPVNLTYDLPVAGDSAVTMICAIYDVALTVVDSRDEPLEKALVIVRMGEGGEIVDSGTTDEVGEVNLELIGGDYHFEVFWHTVLVRSGSIGVTGDPMQVRAEVYYVDLTTQDSHEIPVSDCSLSVYSGETLVSAGSTDDMGSRELRLPAGEVEVEAYWKNVLVYSDTLLVDDDAEEVLDVAVYHITFTVKDSKGEPVPNAGVFAYLSGTADLLDSNTTGSNGKTSMRLPACQVTLEVFKDGIRVFRQTGYDITGDGDASLGASIYYVDLTAMDSEGLPVEDVSVYFRSGTTGELTGTGGTDANGSLTLRLPGGAYAVEAYWKEVLVFTDETFDVSGDLPGAELSLSVFHVTFEVTDSRDAPLRWAGLTVESQETGGLLDSGSTDKKGELTVRLPGCPVNIEVVWDDVTVYFEEGYTVEGTGTKTIDASVFYLTVQAMDTEGLPVVGAAVVLEADGVAKYSKTTRDSGTVTMKVPTDTYGLEITWRGVTVGSMSSLAIDSDRTVKPTLAVYHVTFRMADSADVALEGARLDAFRSGTDELMSSGTAGTNGSVTFILPGTPVDLVATWSSHVVYTEESYSIDSTHVRALSAGVYYVAVQCLDSDTEPVDNATVVATSALTGEVLEASRTSDTGAATFRLPGGSMDFSVRWLGFGVFDGNVTITADVAEDSPSVLSCDIHAITIMATDSKGAPLADASVTFTPDNYDGVLAAIATDADGVGAVRLPGAVYLVEVRWMGAVVYQDPSAGISSSDDAYALDCSVHYLGMDATDSKDLPLEGATVTIRSTSVEGLSDGATTDDGGKTGFRLPAGDYDVEVVWMDVVVATQGSYSLDADGTLPLACAVHHMTVATKDVDSVALADAWVTVTPAGNGSGEMNGMTDAAGASAFRLPEGDYDVAVDWMGVRVYDETGHSLNDSGTLDAACSVYYLTVRAVDSGSKGISGVPVTVTGTDNGIALAERTEGNGEVEFRLPAGNYEVSANLKDTVDYQSVDETAGEDVALTGSQEVVLKFSDYPPEYTTTPAFFAVALPISLLSLLLLLVLVLPLVLRKRKAGKKDEDDVEGEGEGGLEEVPPPGKVHSGPAVKRGFIEDTEAEENGKADGGDEKNEAPDDETEKNGKVQMKDEGDKKK